MSLHYCSVQCYTFLIGIGSHKSSSEVVRALSTAVIFLPMSDVLKVADPSCVDMYAASISGQVVCVLSNFFSVSSRKIVLTVPLVRTLEFELYL